MRFMQFCIAVLAVHAFKVGDKVRTTQMNTEEYNNRIGTIEKIDDATQKAVIKFLNSEERKIVKFERLCLLSDLRRPTRSSSGQTQQSVSNSAASSSSSSQMRAIERNSAASSSSSQMRAIDSSALCSEPNHRVSTLPRNVPNRIAIDLRGRQGVMGTVQQPSIQLNGFRFNPTSQTSNDNWSRMRLEFEYPEQPQRQQPTPPLAVYTTMQDRLAQQLADEELKRTTKREWITLVVEKILQLIESDGNDRGKSKLIREIKVLLSHDNQRFPFGAEDEDIKDIFKELQGHVTSDHLFDADGIMNPKIFQALLYICEKLIPEYFAQEEFEDSGMGEEYKNLSSEDRANASAECAKTRLLIQNLLNSFDLVQEEVEASRELVRKYQNANKELALSLDIDLQFATSALIEHEIQMVEEEVKSYEMQMQNLYVNRR